MGDFDLEVVLAIVFLNISFKKIAGQILKKLNKNPIVKYNIININKSIMIYVIDILYFYI